MEVVWIFLGTFAAVGIIIGVIALYVNIKDKSDSIKLAKYFTNEGKADIEKLEAYMKSKKIKLPAKSNDLPKYVQKLLDELNLHYFCAWKSRLSKSHYKYGCTIENFGAIYSNSENVLIYDDVLYDTIFFRSLEPAVKSGVKYKHTNAKSQKQYWTIEQVLDYFESLGAPKAQLNFARSIPLEDFYWYVKYPESMGSRTVGVGGGAIAGGVLLGPAGALIGASASAKRQEKEKAAETSVILGHRSVECWCVAKGESNSNKVIASLESCFPQNRYKDAYKKHL